MLEHTGSSPAPSVRNADAIKPGRVGVIGATSLVGICLLPMLVESGWQVLAFSRRKLAQRDDGVERRQLPSAGDVSAQCAASKSADVTPCWVCVAPIWVLAEHFALLESCGVRRVVVLSSTSRFTKDSSSNPQEQALARRLADAETSVQAWAESHGVEWMILRPTLIYGMGADKNVTEIAHFIRRFGFFPLLGKATGLRQPIHATDVATVCVSALQTSRVTNRDLNISGGETLT